MALRRGRFPAYWAAYRDALADTELTVEELTEAIAGGGGAWAVEPTMEAFQDRWPRWRQLTAPLPTAGCCASDRTGPAT